jgi:hypothetical protein
MRYAFSVKRTSQYQRGIVNNVADTKEEKMKIVSSVADEEENRRLADESKAKEGSLTNQNIL